MKSSVKSLARSVTTEMLYQLIEDKFSDINKRLDNLEKRIDKLEDEVRDVKNIQMQTLQVLTQLITNLSKK